MEEEIREIFEIIEQINTKNNFLIELADDDLIKEIQKLKFEYFKKGYLMNMISER